ncbi:unnamed protein product [Mucor circinelloides]
MGTPNLIQLNVGGQMFKTYCDTLMDSSYFQNLEQGVPQPDAIRINDDKKPAIYFIDRDPEIFRDIMTYLKTWKIHSTDEHYLRILQREALFYGFDDMVKRIDQMLSTTAPSEKVFNVAYQSKEAEYLPVNFDTVKFDSTANETLVQAFRYTAFENHQVSKIVVKES